jgi:putative ABC transport system permease protein
MKWRRFFRREQADAEQRQELESYLEITTEEYIALGMEPSAARRAASRKLGNITLIREEVYRMNTVGFLDSLGRELRYAFRSLRHHPAFAVTAVATLAIGIGANTAIFSVVNGVLLKPLPYPEADRLVSVKHQAPGINIAELGTAPYLYFAEREENRTLESIGLWGIATATVTKLAEPEEVQNLRVTSDILPVLGIEPQHGRYFSQKDDSPGSPLSVVLMYGYWHRHFGGNTSVIGQRLVLDGKARDIIGVMPQEFRFIDRQVDVITPLQFDRSKLAINDYNWRSLARLKPGVTLDQASADIRRIIPIAFDEFPLVPGSTRAQLESVKLGPNLRSLKRDVVGSVADTMWVLMGAIGIVLLIACANVANLLLVRAEVRQQELAVRAALGAGWTRIARELLVETTVLGFAGGLVGLGVAAAGLRLLLALGPKNVPRLDEITIDPAVLWFTLVASLLSALLLGLIPVVKYAGPQLSDLRAGARSLTPGRERHRVRSLLAAAQIAFALLLLVSAGLMMRTFRALNNVDPGFSGAEQVQTLRISIPAANVPEPERVARLESAIRDRIAALPGVTAVAFASEVPMGGTMMGDLLVPEGKALSETYRPQVRRFKFISPGLFQTLRTPLVAGRDLTWTEVYERRPVVLISENLARREWSSPTEALGKRLRGGSVQDLWREIVGVVGDIHSDGVSEPATETVYLPVLLDGISLDGAFNGGTVVRRSVALVIRSPRTGSAGFLDEIQNAVRAENSELPLAQIRTLADFYNQSLARTSFTLVMLAIAGTMALLLGVVGIYGVLAYAVEQRRREVGIRLALGGQPRAVSSMFVRHGLALSGVGVAVGLLAGAGLSRLMSSLLFGVTPLDPITYAGAVAVLVIAALAACYIPARRAAAVDPMETLRGE